MPTSPLLSSAMRMLSGGAMRLVLSLALWKWGHVIWAEVSIRSALALGYLIVFCGTLDYGADAYLLMVSISAAFATFADVNPAVVMLLGWGVAPLLLSSTAWGSSLLVLVALYFLTDRRA